MLTMIHILTKFEPGGGTLTHPNSLLSPVSLSHTNSHTHTHTSEAAAYVDPYFLSKYFVF